VINVLAEKTKQQDQTQKIPNGAADCAVSVKRCVTEIVISLPQAANCAFSAQTAKNSLSCCQIEIAAFNVYFNGHMQQITG
jgi:hypothetical protein